MSHPVVAYQVAVGRYVQEAGRPVEVNEEEVEVEVVLLDLAGQAGEAIAGWLLPCCQLLLNSWSLVMVALTLGRRSPPG